MSKKPKAATMKSPSSDVIADETIAARAYVKWQQRGCPLWDQDQDWFAARLELEQELIRDHAHPASKET